MHDWPKAACWIWVFQKNRGAILTVYTCSVFEKEMWQKLILVSWCILNLMILTVRLEHADVGNWLLFINNLWIGQLCFRPSWKPVNIQVESAYKLQRWAPAWYTSVLTALHVSFILILLLYLHSVFLIVLCDVLFHHQQQHWWENECLGSVQPSDQSTALFLCRCPPL